MKSQIYIEQEISIRDDIHFNDGVWWRKVAPFFCKPVNPFQVIERGKATPKLHKSFIGYNHIVSEARFASKYWSVLSLSNNKLKDFSISKLSSSKRSSVRKGLKLTKIIKIENITSVLQDMKNICISAAIRTNHGKPPDYYDKYYDQWESLMIKLYNLSNREWWGSFYQGQLIAYYYALQIDNTMIIEAAKSQTDFFDKCPNDALLFSFLEYCRDLPDCEEVIFGDFSSDAPSLNAFKQKFGFEKLDLPVYDKYNPLVYLAKMIYHIYHKIKFKK